MAGQVATETENELSQPKFGFTNLANIACETNVEAAGDRASRRPTTFISHMCGTSGGGGREKECT